MKLIHCADLHMGSPLSSRMDSTKSAVRRAEIDGAFARLCEYAEQNDVYCVLLSGDIFDSDRPTRRAREAFFDVVKAHPSIKFYYLRGNHDKATEYEGVLDNLMTFSTSWTSYTLGEITISGIELEGEGADNLYALSLDSDKYNVVMLHGTTGGDINLVKLRERNIDYLALGHIHARSEGKIDARGVWAYSGCLEGRGFDEAGEKGFYILDTDKNRLQFIPFAVRKFIEAEIDLTGQESVLSVTKLIKEQGISPRDCVRIILKGEVAFDTEGLCEYVQSHFENTFFALSVKDKTIRKIDISKYEGTPTLMGEYIKFVYADDNVLPQDKIKVIEYGLRLLKGDKA